MKNKTLPLTILLAGCVSGALRWLLYAITTDAKNLIPVGNPLEIILWIVTAAVAVLISAGILPLGRIDSDTPLFRLDLTAALGSLAASAGIFLTVLSAPTVSGTLGLVWKILGFASVAALILVAIE